MTMTRAPHLASFRRLREVARAEGIKEQIETRRDQVALAGWDIVPAPEAARALKGNHAAMAEFSRRRLRALQFFRHPDPNYLSFREWLAPLAEDLLVTDATAVRLRKTKDGKRLASLDLLDGTTVEPWPDAYGRAAGTRQYLSEIPRRSFAEITASPAPDCTLAAAYPPGEIQYLAMTVRCFTPFGCSPLEAALAWRMGGEIDLAATAERLRQTADGRWATACRDWLRTGLFAFVLERFGDDLRWEWEAERAQDECDRA